MSYIIDPLTLRPGGVLIHEERTENFIEELPTFTCCHCNNVVVVNPARKRPRNTCRKCMALTCDAGPCVLECDPVARKLEQLRPLLLPHQVPPEKAEVWFPKAIRDKTPDIWLPGGLR